MTKINKKKDMLIIWLSDTHCGDAFGLTPPLWHKSIRKYKEELDKNQMSNTEGGKLMLQRKLNHEIVRQESWRLFTSWIKKIKSLNKHTILVCNGDLHQGASPWNAGVELIEPDPHCQSNMAVKVINYINASEVYMIGGTGVHDGNKLYLESVTSTNIPNVKAVSDHLFLDVNGVIFDVKHFQSGGSTKGAVNNALTKQQESNHDWHIISEIQARRAKRNGERNADRHIQPLADYIVRSHRHTFTLIENERGGMVSLPGLQSLGSQSGARIYSNRISWGITWCIVDVKGNVAWSYRTRISDNQRAKVYVEKGKG